MPLSDAAYAANYPTRDRARHYLEKYETQATKRWSTKREIRLIRRLLATAAQRVGPIDAMLDAPSGPGRLLGAYGPLARRLAICDISPAMVGEAQASAPRVHGQRRDAFAASALSLPFKDASFDCVVSIRLAHHLVGAEAFERYLRELTRVSRGAVLFTFFSTATLKNRLRNLSVRIGRSPHGKNAIEPDRMREIAREAGFEVAASMPLSRLASGHLYTLLIRTGDLARRLNRPSRDQLFRASRGSDVYRMAAADGRSYGVFVKRYPSGGAGRTGADRARGEWDRLLDLRAVGAPVARPLAFGTEGGVGWLYTEEVAGGRSLKEILSSGEGAAEAAEAARSLARMHEAGWILGTSYAKNALVIDPGTRSPESGAQDPGPGSRNPGQVVWIDLPRARRQPQVSAEAGWDDLARLYKAARALPEPDRRAFADAYLSERGGGDASRLLAWLDQRAKILSNETPGSALLDRLKRAVRRSFSPR